MNPKTSKIDISDFLQPMHRYRVKESFGNVSKDQLLDVYRTTVVSDPHGTESGLQIILVSRQPIVVREHADASVYYTPEDYFEVIFRIENKGILEDLKKGLRKNNKDVDEYRKRKSQVIEALVLEEVAKSDPLTDEERKILIKNLYNDLDD